MDKIGSLYQIKKWYWLVFPNKEISADHSHCGAIGRRRAHHADQLHAVADAAWYSKRYNCNITYVSPEEIFVLLETDGKCKKFLSTNGDIGWTWFDEHNSSCFEELNQP